MCLARRTNFSRKTSGTPNAVPASRRAWSSAASSSSADSTTRMPRPPPPIAALTITGIAERLGQRVRLGGRAGPARRCPRGRARPASRAMLARGDLVAELVEQLGPRADEGDPGRVAGPGELGVLGEEAVAGMDRVDLLLLRQRDDAGDVEVAADRLARLADRVRLVGLEAVQGEAVFVRVDRDGADAQLVGRPKHPDGDLAPVGDQQLADLGHHSFPIFVKSFALNMKPSGSLALAASSGPLCGPKPSVSVRIRSAQRT